MAADWRGAERGSGAASRRAVGIEGRGPGLRGRGECTRARAVGGGGERQSARWCVSGQPSEHLPGGGLTRAPGNGTAGAIPPAPPRGSRLTKAAPRAVRRSRRAARHAAAVPGHVRACRLPA